MRLQDLIDFTGLEVHQDHFIDPAQPLSVQYAQLNTEMVCVSRTVNGNVYTIELGWEEASTQTPAFVCTLVCNDAWEHPIGIGETPDAHLAMFMFQAYAKWLAAMGAS